LQTEPDGDLQFDVPQLGLKSVRLDFAKDSQGVRTSFGIGRSV